MANFLRKNRNPLKFVGIGFLVILLLGLIGYLIYRFAFASKDEPNPDPDPNPNPDPTPDPNPNPDPTPDPNPNPDPEPEPEPTPDPPDLEPPRDMNKIYNGDVLLLLNKNSNRTTYLGWNNVSGTGDSINELYPYDTSNDFNDCLDKNPSCHFWFVVKIGDNKQIVKDTDVVIKDADVVRLYHLGNRYNYVDNNGFGIEDTCDKDAFQCSFLLRKVSAIKNELYNLEDIKLKKYTNSSEELAIFDDSGNPTVEVRNLDGSIKNIWRVQKIRNDAHIREAHQQLRSL